MEITLRQLGRNVGEYIAQAETMPVTITRHGRNVAIILPYSCAMNLLINAGFACACAEQIQPEQQQS